jgi:predicted TIM-barrel fold metal-dependent hydrolase
MKIVSVSLLCLVLTACAQVTQLGAVHVPPPRVAAHQHLISPMFAPIAKAAPLDGQALLHLMDQAGNERGVVLSTAYTYGDERKKIPEQDRDRLTASENDWTSQQVERSHGRLVGFCSVDPVRATALAELDRCLHLPGIVGLKLHFGNSGISLRNPEQAELMKQIFAAANARHAAIVVHLRARTGAPYSREDAQLFLEKLLPKAPDVVVQVAHLAGSGPGYPDYAAEAMQVFVDAVQRHDPRTRNLYFDQATDAAADSTVEDGRTIARIIRGVGVKRVFFGSDLPIGGNPPPAESWKIFKAKVPLTPAELRTIALNVPPYMRHR